MTGMVKTWITGMTRITRRTKIMGKLYRNTTIIYRLPPLPPTSIDSMIG